ncbi:hypothetical protein [Erwinia amylovora]
MYKRQPVYASVKSPPQDIAFCSGQRWRMQLILRPVHARCV